MHKWNATRPIRGLPDLIRLNCQIEVHFALLDFLRVAERESLDAIIGDGEAYHKRDFLVVGNRRPFGDNLIYSCLQLDVGGLLLTQHDSRVSIRDIQARGAVAATRLVISTAAMQWCQLAKDLQSEEHIKHEGARISGLQQVCEKLCKEQANL